MAKEPRQGEDVLPVRHGRKNVLLDPLAIQEHAQNLASTRPAILSFAEFGAQAIPLPGASIDVVMMFRSLHHVPIARLDDAFGEIHRVLKPGGCVYISEPIFAGELNEMMRIFNDEEAARRAAFDAARRAVESGLFELASETFFLVPANYRDFGEFEKRHFQVTFSERKVSQTQRDAVRALFDKHMRPEGVEFAQPVRVDLLRKPR